MLKRSSLAACARAVAARRPAQAQPYPNRPIRMLVGFPPGGSTDLAARVARASSWRRRSASRSSSRTAPAPAATSRAEAVARAAPDGYTLMMAATSFAAAPAFFDKLGWDPVKDFTPIVAGGDGADHWS